MMVNEQDQMLNFPAGLQFSPYAFFLNLSAAPRVLRSQVYYMEGKTVKTLSLPDMTLAAGEAKELPIHDLMKPLPAIMDMTLVSSYSGYEGEILSATGSTDTSGNYVFPVIAEPIAPSGVKKYVFWQFSGGFDSMYSIWNPLPTAQKLLATISYGDKGETFKLPVNLDPYASTMVDIGELERSQLADRDGRALPLSAHFGSFELGDASEAPNAMMTVVTNSGIYNPTKGTCGNGSEVCCGASDFEEYPDNITLPDGSLQQVGVSYVGCNGGTYNVTGSSTWLSSNTSVASVQTLGQSQPGMMTARAVGTGNITSTYSSSTPIPINVGTISGPLPLPACPQTNSFTAGAPVQVTPPPHQLLVVADTTSTQNCSLTSVARVITYAMEDSTGAPIVSPVPIHENVPATNSTCNNSSVHTGTGCVLNSLYAPNNLSEFDDILWAGCPSSAAVEPCGFTFTNQQWQYCPTSGSAVSIGTIGPVSVKNGLITVDGNSISLTGKIFTP